MTATLLAQLIYLLGAVFVVGVTLRVAAGWSSNPFVTPFRRAADRLSRQAGTPGHAAVLLGAVTVGIWAASFPVLWVMGKVAGGLEGPVDEPFFDWSRSAAEPSWWTSLNETVTVMGNTPQSRALVVIASVALTVVWRGRHRWLPAVAIVGTYVMEHYAQLWLSRAVDRGYPPTDRGTYFSGGTARVVCVWGVILLLTLVRWPDLGRRWRQGLIAAVALAGFTEGYTRQLLLKHWLTDVISGWLIGLFLLALACWFVSAVRRLPAQWTRAVPTGGCDPVVSER